MIVDCCGIVSPYRSGSISDLHSMVRNTVHISQLHSLSHTVKPRNALQSNIVLLCFANSNRGHAFLYFVLEDVWLRDLYERWMRTELVISRKIRQRGRCHGAGAKQLL